MIKAVVFDYHGVINRNLHLQSEILKLAQDLRKNKIKTAVLSNMVSPIAWILNLRGDFNDFDPVVISGEVGVSKPNPRIYQIIIEKLDIDPEHVLFIDDKLENLIPAKAIGMSTIHAKHTRQIIEDIKKVVGF